MVLRHRNPQDAMRGVSQQSGGDARALKTQVRCKRALTKNARPTGGGSGRFSDSRSLRARQYGLQAATAPYPVAWSQWAPPSALALHRWPARQVLTAVAAALYRVTQSPMFV